MITEEIIKSILGFMTPLLLKGGITLLKKASSQFWELIQNAFQSRKKVNIFNDYISNPDCEQSKTVFSETMKKLFEEEPILAKSFEDLFSQINTSQEVKAENFQSGNNNILIQGHISNSSININKD